MVAYCPERLLQNPHVLLIYVYPVRTVVESQKPLGSEADKADFHVPVNITNPEEELNLINTARTSLIST
jgi:hypothetical protein